MAYDGAKRGQLQVDSRAVHSLIRPMLFYETDPIQWAAIPAYKERWERGGGGDVGATNIGTDPQSITISYQSGFEFWPT